jgi:hypothetical protein
MNPAIDQRIHEILSATNLLADEYRRLTGRPIELDLGKTAEANGGLKQAHPRAVAPIVAPSRSHAEADLIAAGGYIRDELKDNRLLPVRGWQRAFVRPELGALTGTALVFAFFGIFAGNSGMFSAQGIMSFLEVAAQLGILASVAALLIIAGEFDLSVGSMIAFAGVVIAVPTVQFGLPLWLASGSGSRLMPPLISRVSSSSRTVKLRLPFGPWSRMVSSKPRKTYRT